MNLRYLFGALISIPLLPIMYLQGKRIRSSVPTLPEAKGLEGKIVVKRNSRALRIVLIGESTIAGVGVDTHKEGFTGAFGKEVSRLFDRSVEWKVYARSGYTVSKLLSDLLPIIKEKKVDLVVVGIGGNDAFGLNRPSKWRNEVCALIESIQSQFPSAVIIFCNMPPIKEFPAFTSLIKFTIGNLVEILGRELQCVVKDYDHVFYFGERITLREWNNKFNLSARNEDYFSDGIHPSKLAYQTWAKDIANKVYGNNEIKKRIFSSV